MTKPLREPPFLRDQKRVLTRTIIMSAVLAGLTMAYLSCQFFKGMFEPALGGKSIWWDAIFDGLASTAFFYGPLNYWNRRPHSFTLACIPASGFGPLFLDWLLLPSGDRGGSFSPVFSVVTAAIEHAALGLLLVRPTKLHAIAFGVYMLCGLIGSIELVFLKWLSDSSESGSNQQFAVIAGALAVMSGFVLGWAVPWGIPFWWPPERKSRQRKPMPVSHIGSDRVSGASRRSRFPGQREL